ncbi:BEACH domain-containing protein [Tieghemostelium lacteum]|uniref:BEACH domain-containing protein n=1 Tax=Tieghemostelium lacteum TaxID=361077 RepID=A0A152A631_TIELA|nr:BEACH domain-containing protein [Tieghemostelium lacteum]|eukprot:KYR01680.1 BEACH domain-containing protein [Tieghemostelium lacteum]
MLKTSLDPHILSGIAGTSGLNNQKNKQQSAPQAQNIQISTFRYSWNNYLQTVVYQDSLFSLVDFLKYFVQNYYQTPSNLLFLSLGTLSDVSRHLSKRLVEEIGYSVNKGNIQQQQQQSQLLQQQQQKYPSALDIYQYLIGYSIAGEGPWILTSLEILSRSRSNGIPLSMVKLLLSILEKIYKLPSNMLVPPFNNHHRENNNIFQMSSQRSRHYLDLQNFPSIESYFFLPPLPSTLNNLFIQSSLDSTNISANNNNSNSNNTGTQNTNVTSPSQSTTSSTQPNVQSPDFQNPHQEQTIWMDEEVQQSFSGNLFDKFLASSNINLQQQQQPQQQLNNDSTNNTSQLTVLSFQILKIISNLMKEKEFIIELCTSNSLSILTNLFSNSNLLNTNSQDQAIIFKLLSQIFSQIMSHCSLSFETLNLLHKYKLIKTLLNILEKKHQNIHLTINLIIDISKIIVYTIKSSSRIYKSLHDDFLKHNGYSTLLNTFVYISDFGTLKNKIDYIRTTCDLLFIGSSAFNNQFSKENIANIRIFEIYLNVFSTTNSEETKTELLKCIKSIFYLGVMSEDTSVMDPDYLVESSSSVINTANTNGNGGNSGSNMSFNDDGLIKFQQLEPFKILFSQFDNLNISNRKMILEMMDLLLLRDRISQTEIKFYCNLFQSKYPSTILLVTQHLTELLKQMRISKDVLKECSLIEILLEYLVDPATLRFSAILDSTANNLMDLTDELTLCFQILQERKKTSKFYILWMIVTGILQLLLEFLKLSPQIQSAFVEKQGLKALRSLLNDEYLIQPSLQVIATIAIGKLSLESRIIQDFMEVLFSGGASTESKVLTQRKHILATMCFIFHNNHQAKNSFKSSSGFIWSVSILDVISRTVAAGNQTPSHSNSSNGGTSRTVSHVNQSKNQNSQKATNNEIFFFLKVLIDTLSAVMKNNPSNQEYFRKVIQFSTLSNTLKACGYMEGIYSTSLCDSLLNMAVSGSWPPSCEEHSLEDGSLLSLYSPITSFFPNNTQLLKNFDFSPSVMSPSSVSATDESSLDDSISLIDDSHSTFSSISQLSISNTNNTVEESPRRRNRSLTNDFVMSPQVLLSQTTYTSLDLATELRPSSSQVTLSTNFKLPDKSSLAMAQERFFHCQSCRDGLSIENPEIFKLIILLTGGTQEEIGKIESKSFCYILRELIFLSSCSLVNQKKLSGLLLDIIDHYKPLLLANPSAIYTYPMSPSKKRTSASINNPIDILKLKPLLLELIQSLAGHNLTLSEFRKYFELLKDRNYPIDLLNLLLKITGPRENIPLYYAEFSKNGLEYIDFPYLGERSWPPLKGFGISMWFRYSTPYLNINKTPIFLLSKEGVMAGGKTCEAQLILDNGILYYCINHSSYPSEQISFSEFKFEPDQFYFIVITHAAAAVGQKKSPVKLYVNGCLRGQYMINYPRPQMMTLFIRLGGTNASSTNKDYNVNNSCWHSGNAYFFEDLPMDKEVFYLYLLGPDHFRGLKVDVSMIDSIQPSLDKSTKLHPLLIEHLLNPTVQPLQSLHEKIMLIFTAKCLYVTAHRIANKSEAVTHASAQPQQSSLSQSNPTISTIERTTSQNDFSFSSFNSFNSLSSLNNPNSRKSSLTNSISSSIGQLSMSSGLNSSILTSPGPSPSKVNNNNTNTSTSSFNLDTNSIISIASTIAMPTQNSSQITRSHSNNSLGGPVILNNSFQSQSLSLLSTGLPFPLPPGVISQVGVKDIIINSGGVSVFIYLLAMSQEKEYQRTSLKLLQSVIRNSQQNLKEMRDISGYQLISHIIRRNNWVLDDGLLAILFSFVGVQSTRTSIHYIDGVIADVLALKHFLLERSIWKRASIQDQKKLFESLEKLVNALHENHDFNIIKFRQAGAFETILKMCREDDLPLELLGSLSSILHSIIHKPPKLNGDLKLLLSYLLETMTIGTKSFQNIQSSLSANSTSTGTTSSSSPFSYLRRNRKLFSTSSSTVNNNNNNNNNNSNNQPNSNDLIPVVSTEDDKISSSTQETIRITMLNLMIDILSKADNSILEEFHSICSIETIFGLLIDESIQTRLLFLKIIDICLHSPMISQKFEKMKGFHLLGHQLCSFKMSEELFGVLFCILFGKASTNQDMLGVSMRMYFLSQISDSEMKYPGAIITILITLCNCTFSTQHILIKMIHNIFLQNDQFKNIMLENELVPRLVDILASNFQKRSNQIFNYNYNYNLRNDSDLKEEESWDAEESILSLLKEIALYGAKSQDGSTILRDILVILHLNTKMDQDYTCCLQRRVLFDVISFFHDNKNFGSIDSLVSSYEKLCVLTINTLCYQEKTTASPPTQAATVSKREKAFKSLGNFASTFSPSKSGLSKSVTTTPTGSLVLDRDQLQQQLESLDSISSSNNEQDQTSNNEESSNSNTESDRSAHTQIQHKHKKPTVPIWIKEGNLLNQEHFLILLLTVLCNTKVTQSNTNTYRNLFSTQYSARSLLCKLIYLLLSSPEFQDQTTAVLQHLISVPAQGNPVISDVVLEEDFIQTMFHLTFKYLNNDTTDPEQQRLVVKLWGTIIQSVSYDVIRKVFDPNVPLSALLAAQNSQDPPREYLSKYQTNQVENEFKRWEEKNNQSKREWKLQYLEVQKNKQAIIIKNQDISKSTKKLSDSLIQLKTEYEKSNLQFQAENRESKRFFQTQWKVLIKKVTHEKAIWGKEGELEDNAIHSISDSELSESAKLQKSLAETKWKLDPTEGTHRMRLRLKRTPRNPQFNLIANIPESPSMKSNDQLLQQQTPQQPIQQVLQAASHGSIDYSSGTLKMGEKVNEYFKCSCISPFYQRDGELLIGDQNIYFLDESLTLADKKRSEQSTQGGLQSSTDSTASQTPGTQDSSISSIKPPQKGKHIIWAYDDIIEIHKRRHVLKNSAIEIFLGSGVPHKTYLFAFQKTSDRDIVYDLILSKPLPNRVDYAAEVQGNILKLSITKKWQRGLISNFEYLMHLNTLAGRSFNDLTQYPIFPFILKDYDSAELDLENAATFRDLTKPMGAQDPNRLAKFLDKFNYLQEINEKPYHYGSHYSNIGSVLHFLVRLQPFSAYFIDFQGGRFDVPDRAFHSIAQTWNLSSSISSSDVKELIPEFFYLPDFLVNNNNFYMGTKQDGVKVDNVILPTWAKGDPKLFIKKHLEALECKYVSENIHNWIDLMFGHKQQGEAAIKAYNMFFPLTYEGAVEIDTIEDKLTRDATIAQIHSYGQTPKQLFTKPHPKKNWAKTMKTYESCIYNKYDKLMCFSMWNIKTPVGSIAISGDTTIPLAPQKILLYPDSNKYVSWGHWDQNLRVYSTDTGKVLSIIDVLNDDIICCDITRNGRLFVTGGTAGTVKVWKRCNSDGTLMTRKERGDNLSLWSTLYGHTNSILCITVSQEFSVIVSGSKDRNCIIWDLNRLTYVNTLAHQFPVTCVQVSPTNNYIATFETEIDDSNSSSHIPSGFLRLWTGNGEPVKEEQFGNDRVNCMVFTSGNEGTTTNLLVTGMESGLLILWNATTLEKLKVLNSQKGSPITALAVNKDHTQLIVGDVNGQLEYWSAKTFDGYSAIVGINA